MDKIVAGFIGSPVAIERDLKQDFANRYFETDSVLIVLDGETYDGMSYAAQCVKQLSDGAVYRFTEIPAQFPKEKRVIVVHANYPLTDRETHRYVEEVRYDTVWNDAIRKMALWDFPKVKNVTVYAVNGTSQLLDFGLLHTFLNQWEANDKRLFWEMGCRDREDFSEDKLKHLDMYSDVIAVYDRGYLSIAEKPLREHFSDTEWDDNRPFFFLKNNTYISFYSKILFHSWIKKYGVLLVADDKDMARFDCLREKGEQA